MVLQPSSENTELKFVDTHSCCQIHTLLFYLLAQYCILHPSKCFLQHIELLVLIYLLISLHFRFLNQSTLLPGSQHPEQFKMLQPLRPFLYKEVLFFWHDSVVNHHFPSLPQRVLHQQNRSIRFKLVSQLALIHIKQSEHSDNCFLLESAHNVLENLLLELIVLFETSKWESVLSRAEAQKLQILYTVKTIL